MPKSASTIKRRATVLVSKPKGVTKPAPFSGFTKKEVVKRTKKKTTGEAVGEDAAPVVCSFFKRGKCRNGDDCKFLHPAPEEAKPGEVVKLTNGITAQDLVPGRGDAVVKGRMVSLKYLGRITGQKGAKPFDGTVQGEAPLCFVVGDKTRAPGLVVRGIDVGVVGMRVGGKRKLFVPANMAYGEHGSNFNSTVPTTKRKVPPSTDVEFELVLISMSAAPKNKSESKEETGDDAEVNDEVDEIEAKTGGEQFVSNPNRSAHFKKRMNKAEIKAAYREHGFAMLENPR